MREHLVFEGHFGAFRRLEDRAAGGIGFWHPAKEANP